MAEMVVVISQSSSATSALPSKCLPIPAHLTSLQQQQLTALLEQYTDIFSHSEENTGHTPVLNHIIEKKGPPTCQPYRCQNPAVQHKEAD